MGRAIDMENDIAMLKIEVEKLKNSLNLIMETATTKTNVDIIEETKYEEKETDNKGDGKSSKSVNTGKSVSKNKVSKS